MSTVGSLRDPWATIIASPPSTRDELEDVIYQLYSTGNLKGNYSINLRSKSNESNLVRNTYSSTTYTDFGLEAVQTSCKDNDCMIASFLIDISPLYRKLSLNQKQNFARNFRTKIVPLYSEIQDLINFEPNTIRELKGADFLSYTIGEKLGKIFGVNVIFIDDNRLPLGLMRGQITAASFIARYRQDKPFIFIFNDSNHFRAIRNVSNNAYEFSKIEAEQLVNQMLTVPASASSSASASSLARRVSSVSSSISNSNSNSNSNSRSTRSNSSNQNIFNFSGLNSNSNSNKNTSQKKVSRKVILTDEEYLQMQGLNPNQIAILEMTGRLNGFVKSLQSGLPKNILLESAGIKNVSGGKRKTRRNRKNRKQTHRRRR